MKKKITITGIFNDVFTNYEDKESSISMIVCTEENCTCYKQNGICLIHFPPKGYVLTDVDEEPKTINKIKQQIMKTLLLLLLSTVFYGQTITYSPSNEIIANPERGWYKYSLGKSVGTFSPLSASTLNGYRTNDKITLVLRIYDLGAFKTTAISKTFLNNIQKDFATLRASKMKCILRFRYTEDNATDAPKGRIFKHIDQLKVITSANQDVISLIEAGFIGQYGEWYYSSNFGTYNLTATQLNNRKAVGLKIMELAPTRMVAFRTPFIQQQVGGQYSVSSGDAYNGSINARIALHNDAFLGSSSDEGTFNNINSEYPYLEQQSKFTFCGGESNQLNITYQNCSNALFTLERFHYNYLNFGYYPQTLQLWQDNGCYDEISRRLGYRFELQSSKLDGNILTVSLRNVGFASMFNKTEVFLVCTSGTTVYEVPIATDNRLWSGDYSFTHQISGLPNGTYNLSLKTTDGIKFANISGNNLNQTLTVTNSVNRETIYNLLGKEVKEEDMVKNTLYIKNRKLTVKQ